MWLFLLACKPEPTTPTTTVAATQPAEPVVLSESVTVEAMVAHLDALQDLADINDATRVALSEGYFRSADYIEEQLEAAGLSVTRDPFSVLAWQLSDSDVESDGALFEHLVMTNSPGGDVTADVVPVDVQIPPPATENSTDSGCQTSDFASFPAGAIALIQRGGCTFAEKEANAAVAGASAVLIFNEGQPGRRGIVEGTLSQSEPAGIPTVGISYSDGVALSEGAVATVDVDALLDVFEDYNLTAEITGSGGDGVIMVGAHLDSVLAGPGINDNGSGSAFVLELALQAANSGWQPAHTVRFAWWGAEEQGLVGSRHWVYTEEGEFDEARLDDLAAYLNFDMMASSNGARLLYDGDNSDIDDGGGSEASGEIESLFHDWFDEQGLETAPEGMFIPTDSAWFVSAGIPVGGLFSGAFTLKDSSLVSSHGGTAGVAYDVCYHEACDRLDQVNETLYGELAAAGAHVFQTMAELPGEVGLRDVQRPLPGLPSGCHGRPLIAR